MKKGSRHISIILTLLLLACQLPLHIADDEDVKLVTCGSAIKITHLESGGMYAGRCADAKDEKIFLCIFPLYFNVLKHCACLDRC